MVFLEDGTNLGYIAHHIEQWRFSRSIPAEPPQVLKQNHGFKFVGSKEYTTQDLYADDKKLPQRPYRIKRGMHGVVEQVVPMRVFVKFFNYRDKTSHQPICCWLPSSLFNHSILISHKPYPGKFDKVSYRHEKSAVLNMSHTKEADNSNSSDNFHGFKDVVRQYIKALKASDSPWVPQAFKQMLGVDGENIPVVSQAMIKALKTAGTYDCFNTSGGSFSIQQLQTCCRKVIEKQCSDIKFVIYFILYTDDDVVENHLYVGKTRDTKNRLATYEDCTTNEDNANYNGYHHQLRRRIDSKDRYMGILAQFKGEADYEAHSAVMEQFMVSCLRTYRPVLETLVDKLTPDSLLASYSAAVDVADEDQASEDTRKAQRKAIGVEHYMVYRHIAEEVFKATNYTCGVGTSAFGVDYGVNWNSPLPEAHFLGSYESTLWIKDEFWMADPDPLAPSTTFRMSTFTKSKRNTASYTLQKSGKKKDSQGSQKPYLWKGHFFSGPYEKGGKHRKIVNHNLTSDSCEAKDDVNSVIDGTTIPQEYAKYETQIEVCEDFDRQHPASYTRLPGLDAWQDANRAKSFALRISWKDPNGRSQQHYFQYSDPSGKGSYRQKVDAANFVPGCLTAYELGIALSHWQYGDPILKLPEKTWQREPSSSMFVRVKVYDTLTWTLTFDAPKQLENIPSGAKITWAQQQAQMQAATYRSEYGQKQLLRIDLAGTTTKMMKQKLHPDDRARERDKCDTCYMINMQKCIKMAGDLVCQCCHALGRMRCTWSQGCPQAQDAPWSKIDAQKNHDTKRAHHTAFRSTLLDQKPFQASSGANMDMDGEPVNSNYAKAQREKWLALLEAAEVEDEDEDDK